jgi:predicted MFS family arabinose efflux permease
VLALGAASAVIGIAELGGEGLVGVLTDRLGKVNSLAIGTSLNILSALALPVLGGTLIGAFAGLFLFFLTFEFTIVSLLPLMTEIFPPARGTVMAVNFASLSLGRAVGAFLGVQFFSFGIWGSVGASIGFNLICLGALVLLKRKSDL